MFTADYEMAGPSVYDNYFVDNTYNGVFIRVTTAAGATRRN